MVTGGKKFQNWCFICPVYTKQRLGRNILSVKYFDSVKCDEEFGMRRRNISVSMAADWTNLVRFPVGARDFSTPQCPDLPWSPYSLLSKECKGLLPQG
jgi:hypothetical protein